MEQDFDYLIEGQSKKGKKKIFAASVNGKLKDYRKGNFDYSKLEKLRKGKKVNILMGSKPVLQANGKIIFSEETVVDVVKK